MLRIGDYMKDFGSVRVLNFEACHMVRVYVAANIHILLDRLCCRYIYLRHSAICITTFIYCFLTLSFLI